MTNKPMLSVEREMLERWTAGRVSLSHLAEMRAILDKPDECRCKRYGKYNPHWPCPVHAEPAAQHQGEPVEQSEFEPDAICLESDGCPTEGAVLKRFWRENQPDPVLCEFYEAEDFPSLVRELVGHVAQLQEAAKRNVKPWEDTFPPTLLPAYIARINAEHPEPAADHTQCEECKGWGYHENHHKGGGTECGECGGSGKAPVEQFSGDTVVCRRYQLEQHPGQNFYHYDLDPVYGSVPVTVSELITMVESAPVAVVMPERREPSPSNPHLSDADHEYNSALDDVARLNGVKP